MTSRQTDLVLASNFVSRHPTEAAKVLENHDPEACAALLSAGRPDEIAAVLLAMRPVAASAVLLRLGPKARDVVVEMDLDACTSLVRMLDASERGRFLESMPDGYRQDLSVLLDYPEGTAGSLMDPRVLSVAEDVDVLTALEAVRRTPGRALYYLYVTDRSAQLVGVTSLRDLMMAADDERLSSMMVRSVAKLRADSNEAVILAHPGWTEYHALPVVDQRDRLIGAIRYETLRRIEGSASTPSRAASLALSMGELYWLGLTGIVEGLGRVLGARGGEDGPRD